MKIVGAARTHLKTTGDPEADSLVRAPRGYPCSQVHESVEQADRTKASVGLCARCRFMQIVKSDRGSTFYMCQLSVTDPAYPKYPRLPVLRCLGYQEKKEEVTKEKDTTKIPNSSKSGETRGTPE